MTGAAIPTVDELASDPIPDPYDDMINPAGLTNLLGVAQVDHDVHAIRSVCFPPYSQGDVITGQLFLDGRLARSSGGVVTSIWRPDRVTRSTEIAGRRIETTTVCVPGEFAVAVRTMITAEPGERVEVGLSIESGITRATEQWHSISPQAENVLTLQGATVIGTNRGEVGPESEEHPPTPAATAQAASVPDQTFDQGRLTFTVTADADGIAEFSFVHTTAANAGAAADLCTRLLPQVPELITAAEDRWNAIIAGVFDPESDEFSGVLPVLETDNDALRKLYWWGIIGLIWFRRDNAASVLGRTYDTLSPRHWQTTTFIWDYSLSSLSHALLDPAVMRRHIEHWVDLDIHSHFGTSWLTGGPVGYWYSVNDFAMTRLVRDYLRVTGDLGFLDESIGTGDHRRTVREHVHLWAHAWQGLRGAHPLADYGGIDNLMECVSSYVHEVASLNAANVWCLRVAAEIADLDRREADAADLRAEADDLLGHVQELYVPGTGSWHARQPDGSLVEVRHCYDFTTTGTLIADDLPAAQRTEMINFFVRELQTPTWMRALSPYDPDAAFSVRPDHQWNGAYPAWPADAARALYAMGRPDVAAAWLPGLARSANQGPCGQAHFVEEAEPPVAGGARKSPAQFPYLIDWSCSSSGAWIALILEGVFGLRVALDGEVTAEPHLEGLDPAAKLTGLQINGRTHTVDATGVHQSRVVSGTTGSSRG